MVEKFRTSFLWHLSKNGVPALLMNDAQILSGAGVNLFWGWGVHVVTFFPTIFES